MDTLYIVMPAYNEGSNINHVIKSWYPVLADKGEESRLVVADSGSTDSTHKKLQQLQKCYPQLEILSNTGKEHGPKVMALYDYAIKRGADYIFQTDSDGQTNPHEFAAFWDARKDYDGIFGYRKVRLDGKFRAFAEKIVCLLLRFYFGIKVPDANAPFRLMKADKVKKYLNKLPYNYNLPNIMLTAYFSYFKEKMIFAEISFKKRGRGKNSVNVLKIVKTGWRALGDFWNFKKGLTK